MDDFDDQEDEDEHQPNQIIDGEDDEA